LVYLNLAVSPLKVRELRRVRARDPWAASTIEAEWSIILYRMVMADYLAGEAWKKPKPRAPGEVDPGPGGRALRRTENVGLETAGSGFRLMPRALFSLWREGRVRDEALPRLLHQMEPHLKAADFRPPASPIMIGLLAIPVAAVLLGFIAVALFMPGFNPVERKVMLGFGLFAGAVGLAGLLFVTLPQRRHRRLVRAILGEASS